MDMNLYGAVKSLVEEFGVSGIESIAEKSYNPDTGESILTFTYKDSTGVKKTTDYTIRSGKNGTSVVTIEKNNLDMVFTMSDGKKVTIKNAYVDLKGDKGDKGDSGGGSGTNIHNELENLQGGMTGGKGEYYHLNKKAYDVVNKLTDNKAAELSRIYTKDSENNIANLVSVSDFNALYGNRLVGNTQFSNFREQFTHVYNDGKVRQVVPVSAINVIPPSEYIQDISVGSQKVGGPDISGYFVTKVQIEVSMKESDTPQVGRLEIKNADNKILFQTVEEGHTKALIDNYGNYRNKIVFDIQKPFKVIDNGILTCTFKIETDRVMGCDIDTEQGSKTLPSICLIVEELKDHQIADVNHIYELVPSAVSDESMFIFNIYDENARECLIENINPLDKPLSPYDNLVIPELFKGNNVAGFAFNVNGTMTVKSFSSNSLRWFEFDDTNSSYFFFDGIKELERIHLPNVEDVQHDRFITDCPNLKELYVPKLSNFAVNSSEFISNCPKLTIYTNANNRPLIEWCIDNGVKYEFINMPTSHEVPTNKGQMVLGLNENKYPEWMPIGGGSGGSAVPELIFSIKTANVARPVSLDLFKFKGIPVDSNLMVCCGANGVATPVSSFGELNNEYSCAYYVDKLGAMMYYYIKGDSSALSNLDIYRFVPSSTPPETKNPYITLNDVIGDVKQTTKKGERFDLLIDIKGTEFMRNPKITIDTWGWWETVNIIFDGKAKYYYEFPRDLTESWEVGSRVGYTLSWQDQLGMKYEGFEEVIKEIVI